MKLTRPFLQWKRRCSSLRHTVHFNFVLTQRAGNVFDCGSAAKGPLSLTGHSALRFQRTARPRMPAGLVSGTVIQYIPSSYARARSEPDS